MHLLRFGIRCFGKVYRHAQAKEAILGSLGLLPKDLLEKHLRGTTIQIVGCLEAEIEDIPDSADVDPRNAHERRSQGLVIGFLLFSAASMIHPGH